MSRITESARGEECQVRIPGVCNRDSNTVVFAHLNGGGIGQKHPDSEGAYTCSACHDAYDRRSTTYDGDNLRIPGNTPGVIHVYTPDDIDLMFFEGCVRTRKILIDEGLLICS